MSDANNDLEPQSLAEAIQRKRERGRRGPKPGHGGRPKTLLKPEKIAQKLAALGLTMIQIAGALGISERTLRQWKVDNRKLTAAIKKGRSWLTLRIEDSLAQKALGMTIPETKVSVINGRIVLTTIQKHLPPDTLACIFWLKNRAPERWGDRHDVRVQQTIAGLPEETLRRIKALARANAFGPAKAQVVDVETRLALPAPGQ
jgi:transcriptional regulator with XRE-family HTH domain